MKKRWYTLGVVLIVGTLFVGCGNEPQPVSQGEVISGVEESVTEVEGRVIVETGRSFYLDFPGTVMEVYVKEGQSVKKGDVLFTLDISSYETLIEQKKNQLALQTLQLKQKTEAMPTQNAYMSHIRSQIQTKESELANNNYAEVKLAAEETKLLQNKVTEVTKDYEIALKLHEVGGASQKEVEAYENTLKELNSQLQQVTIQLNSAKKLRQVEIDTLKAQLSDLQTNTSKTSHIEAMDSEVVALTQAMLQKEIEEMEKKLQVDYLEGNKVIAPADNLIISDLAVEEGTKLETLMTPVCRGKDKSERVVLAKVPEEYRDNLKVGDKVQVIPYVDEEKVLEGTVVRMAEEAKDNYGETVVETVVEVEDPEGILLVGSPVDVTF